MAVLESWSLGKACCRRSQLLGSIYALLMVHISAPGTNVKLLVEFPTRINRSCFIDQVDLFNKELRFFRLARFCGYQPEQLSVLFNTHKSVPGVVFLSMHDLCYFLL